MNAVRQLVSQAITHANVHIYVHVHCRHLTLENELEVLLVSDVATEKAAASVAVRVGEL